MCSHKTSTATVQKLRLNNLAQLIRLILLSFLVVPPGQLHLSQNKLCRPPHTFFRPIPVMCFRFRCIACQQLLAYFCGPPYANATNDFPPLCRSNAHTQKTGFKCMTCERLDGVARNLEAWLRFHPNHRAEPGNSKTSTDSAKLVRERVYPGDARSPWFSPFATLSNLKRALAAAGVNRGDIRQRIRAEQKLREDGPAEGEEIEETAAHNRDRCCFCLDNFTCLPVEVSIPSTPTASAHTEVIQPKMRSRSNSPVRREVKRPRRW